MNIFSKLFKKKSVECNSIVSLANLVKDPDKDFFNKHKQDVKELEKTYGEILKQNKTITSLDFTLPNNNKDSNYYSTTLLKITIELDSGSATAVNSKLYLSLAVTSFFITCSDNGSLT